VKQNKDNLFKQFAHGKHANHVQIKQNWNSQKRANLCGFKLLNPTSSSYFVTSTHLTLPLLYTHTHSSIQLSTTSTLTKQYLVSQVTFSLSFHLRIIISDFSRWSHRYSVKLIMWPQLINILLIFSNLYWLICWLINYYN
jgi:hypothetical protein